MARMNQVERAVALHDGPPIPAQVFAQQGRSEEALAALQTALDKRDPGLVFLQVDPMLDPIRAHPRFVAIVKQIDFPT